MPLGAPLKRAFGEMLQHDAGWVAVLDGERFAGVLTPAGLHEALRRSVDVDARGVTRGDVDFSSVSDAWSRPVVVLHPCGWVSGPPAHGGRQGLRPRPEAKYLNTYRGRTQQVRSTLAYVDAVHFAARGRAPALFSTALEDQTCPPSTVFAAFNDHEGGGPPCQFVWSLSSS